MVLNKGSNFQKSLSHGLWREKNLNVSNEREKQLETKVKSSKIQNNHFFSFHIECVILASNKSTNQSKNCICKHQTRAIIDENDWRWNVCEMLWFKQQSDRASICNSTLADWRTKHEKEKKTIEMCLMTLFELSGGIIIVQHKFCIFFFLVNLW